ncbi:MAG: SDR family NAD(P)-dependent oxidoreductase [Bacteroidia bacterium]|nr:SDR family NAD(P)-dependent oxidoreductase [Bacteroidia bacterium]NNJ56251.1 SDR family NAD(P)-dependent oxidoreductase [Bacteroidia bacterium]
MNNKLILITGGSSGIGKAAANQLHKQGAKIILQARNLEKLKTTALEIDPSGNRVSYYSTDLKDQDSVELSAQKIIENEGIPDVVINSAGSGEWLSFKEASLSHFKNTMDSPYIATALTCKVFFDKMQERGNGHFIIINSVAAYFSFPEATGYTPARWALLGFSRSLQADLFNTNFYVSMIALGKVESPYFENNPRSEDRIPKIANWLVPTMSPNEAGEVITKNVSTKKAIVIKPFAMALFVFLNRLFPGIFRWLMRMTCYK